MNRADPPAPRLDKKDAEQPSGTPDVPDAPEKDPAAPPEESVSGKWVEYPLADHRTLMTLGGYLAVQLRKAGLTTTSVERGENAFALKTLCTCKGENTRITFEAEQNNPGFIRLRITAEADRQPPPANRGRDILMGVAATLINPLAWLAVGAAELKAKQKKNRQTAEERCAAFHALVADYLQAPENP